MEDDAFEVSAPSVTKEPFQIQRSFLGEQPGVDVPERRVDRRFVGER